MPAISRDEVAHLSSLARIELSEDELDAMAGELAVILDALARVREAAGPDVVAMSHPIPLTNVMRPDEVHPGLTRQQALSGAPEVEDERFSVPRILDED